ncbi:Hexuronate transporter [Acidisarcina polymorpha]|uniref:Hexuronate transporter n=1 Tax=Acidisarcina polymorpha TaxID=2211140 RepID=A0A2Z5G0F7_9BACT|nr:MFS transporter [Acidisarcina polymorpha]AXC12641.1 Hexuronate transporter [Acidisarcina polymorpha]
MPVKIMPGQPTNPIEAKHTPPTTSGKSAGGNVRWRIGWVLFCSTVINYISRQTFSVLSPMITAQFHLTHTQLGKIMGAFQVSYAFTWLIGGIILDIVGTRIGLAAAVILWSTVNMITGLASSAFGFAAFRFMLGIGEGFNWPGAGKAVAEWFPDQERSLAVAVFDSGSSVGGMIAALAIPWIALSVGWRWAFIFSGSLGFIWLFVWLRVYHPLDRHPRVTGSEATYIRSGQTARAKSIAAGWGRWGNLLRERNLWGVVLGRALTDPIWWFYVFWLPQYLSDARGFSLQRIALFAWIPFVAADIGNFTGGALSGYWVRRGMPVLEARLWVCAISCVPMLAGIPAARVHNSYFALALICVALWGFASWSTMGLTLPADLFPQDVVATVTGVSGLAAGLAGSVFTYIVGVTADRFSYGPAFLVAGLMPLAATAAIYMLIDRRAPSATSARNLDEPGPMNRRRDER